MSTSVLSLRKTSGGQTTLAEFGPGGFFGETALLFEVTRSISATETAVAPLLLLALTRADYASIIAMSPEVEEKTRQIVHDRLVEKLFAMQLPFLEGLDKRPRRERDGVARADAVIEAVVTYKHAARGRSSAIRPSSAAGWTRTASPTW